MRNNHWLRKNNVSFLLGKLCILSLFSLPLLAAPSVDELSLLSKPDFVAHKTIKTYFDGREDDLLTAGWSHQQLQKRTLPPRKGDVDFRWLRRSAYFNNTIALIDTTEGSGYGKLFGPNKDTPAVPGYEYLSYTIDKNNHLDATLLLQIPDNFNRTAPCIIVAASSGSRGIYGAVGTVGTWALKQRCAVAYTDKGTGTGFYFFDESKGFDVQGNYTAQQDLLFSEEIETNDTKKSDFLKKHPHAISVKQAYSKKNIEKDFGLFVLQAGQFALYQLNQHFLGDETNNPENAASKNNSSVPIFTAKNTTIVAASISNGGVASLKAGELDQTGFFDGVVVAEPNVSVHQNDSIEIIQGAKTVPTHSLASFDYFTVINMFAPCTLLTPQAQGQPFGFTSEPQKKVLQDWCQSLKKDGFLQGNSIEELANESLAYLSSLGIKDNQQRLSPLMQFIELWPALATNYTNQVGRFSIEDNVCGVYYAALDSNQKPISLNITQRADLFGSSNGIPPTAGIKLYNAKQWTDYQTAKCFYELSKSERMVKGVDELMASAITHSRPTIIVHGRQDSLIQPNHSSRPYYANALLNHQNNKTADKGTANIRYYEVTNAHHFDAFNALPHYAGSYISLHYYFEQSLDLMMQHLTEHQALPASQVIHTQTRNTIGAVLQETRLEDLPSISHRPKFPIELQRSNRISRLVIPD